MKNEMPVTLSRKGSGKKNAKPWRGGQSGNLGHHLLFEEGIGNSPGRRACWETGQSSEAAVGIKLNGKFERDHKGALKKKKKPINEEGRKA